MKTTQRKCLCNPFQCQSKLKRNETLFKKVGNLKVPNLNLREENKHIKQRLQLDDETKRRLELLEKVVEI